MHKIKNWSFNDQPRNKLIQIGKENLTVAELMSIIIGSGYKELNCINLSKEILQSYNFNLYRLSQLNVSELMKFKGIGEAKALSIIAAFELGRRKNIKSEPRKIKIEKSKDAFDLLSPLYSHLAHEEFKIILLNRNNRVVNIKTISKGGISGTVVDPKIIFKCALEQLASSIILAHNHPSGNLKPSQPDINITKKLVEAGKHLEIQVLDHIIVSREGYYSFADEGLI